MKKFSDASGTCPCALGGRLGAIKLAHDQLHLLTGMATTATVLARQIELCDVLLIEISGIRSSLARDLDHTRGAPQPDARIGLNA
jgi:hypothetical protein